MPATRRAEAAAVSITEKSPTAFRTISEVAETLNVPAHVLRFWESKFTQIKPVKRGGGRRYYRPADVSLFKGIRELLYSDGLTIKGVQKILRQKGPRHVIDIGDGRVSAFESAPMEEELDDMGVAEPPLSLFRRDDSGPRGGTPDLFGNAKSNMPLEEDLVARVAEIAEGETKHRDELREIVRKLEVLRDKMRSR